MSLVHLPRALGAFAILWAVRDAYLGTLAGPIWATALFYALAAGWLVAGLSLVRGKEQSKASFLVITLAIVETVALFPSDPMGLQWFVWVGLILLMTPTHIDERVLLLKVLVSVVYVIAAVSKLNPPWLAGDSMAMLARTRAHLDPLTPLLTSDWGSALAVLTIILEAGVLALLWSPHTRRVGVVLGAGIHAMLIVVATPGFPGFINLLVLNGGLVVLYPAFFHECGGQTSLILPASPEPSSV